MSALSEDEREALWRAGDHHPDLCDCSTDDWPLSDGQLCDGLLDTITAVEDIIAARVQAAADERAERIAAAIEAESSGATLLPDRAAAAWHDALTDAARIARGSL